MENDPNFNLATAIESWRAELAAQPNLTAEVRRELETHLLETIQEFQRRGLSEREACSAAMERIGPPHRLNREFTKVEAPAWNARLAGVAWALFIISFFLPAAMDARGYQCASLLLSPWMWRQALHGDWQSMEFLLMLVSNLIMLASPFLFIKWTGTARSLRWVRRATFLALFFVWSWFGRGVLSDLFIAHDSGLAGILPGFYVWAASFLILHLAVHPQFTRSARLKPIKLNPVEL
jgi:hypothetical protein